MAMNAATLGAAMATAAGSTDPAGIAAWLAVATQIVSHITANAVATITVATATGVTAGAAVVPVAGIATIT